jgi:hypothetical protein
MGFLKTILGLSSGVSPWLYAVVFALGLAAGGSGVGWVMHQHAVALTAQRDSARHDLATMTADRDAKARAVKVGQGIITGMQKQWDEADAKAQATIKAQQQQAGALAAELQTTTDQREAYLQQLKEAGHARPIVVSQTVHDGWDPVVVAGMRRLKCVQLAALGAGNLPAADCGVQAPDGAGRPVAPGDPAGAGDYRPTFDQQLQFLADAWRLRDWGASCYADKRAIAAAQPKETP